MKNNAQLNFYAVDYTSPDFGQSVTLTATKEGTYAAFLGQPEEAEHYGLGGNRYLVSILDSESDAEVSYTVELSHDLGPEVWDILVKLQAEIEGLFKEVSP